jgi:hypothetical protein
MSISRSIVEAVRSMNPSGRFLEKNVITNMWSDIGDRKAIEKTSQALRDGAATLRKQLSQDLNDPDFLSAVFDMESSSTAVPVKTKEKPTKVSSLFVLYFSPTLPCWAIANVILSFRAFERFQTKIAKKGGHRRVKSNPDVMSAAKQKALLRKLKSADLPQKASPRVSISSTSGTPSTQRPRRVSHNDRDCTQSTPCLDPASPSPPPMPPPERFPFRGAQRSSTMSVMRSASFDSPHTQPFEEVRTPQRMSWHYNPHRFGPSHHPPLSPQSGYSPNRPEYMSRHPMSPGGHPMPPGGHPMSPGGHPIPPGGHPMPPGGYPMPPGGHPMSPGSHSMSRHPMSPGGHPMSPRGHPIPPRGHPMSPGLAPEYAHSMYRPSMSPVMNHSWSPQSYTFGQPPASPQSSPGPGWRSPISVHRRYRHGELSFPVLSRESSMPSREASMSMPMPSREDSMAIPVPPIRTNPLGMCMSPMPIGPPAIRYHEYRSCPSSPADFSPPPRQSLAPASLFTDKSQGTNRDSPTTMPTNRVGKSKSSSPNIVYHSSTSSSGDSPTSTTTVLVCGALDESRSDNMLCPEVEVILTDARLDPEMTLDYTTEEDDFEPLNKVSNDSEAFSPLPFDHVGSNEESYIEMSDDLFQMPIAPCDGDL